jgi:hypothetical protein
MIKHGPATLGVALWIAFAGHTAHAACEKGAVTVFACLTAQGKRIEVCESGRTIDYSFGYPNQKPDIVVQAPRAQASTRQWHGVGRAITYSVDVPNGDTVYRVFWGLDRLSEARSIEAGVQVEIARKPVATVNCAGEKHIVQNIEGIQLRPSE